MVPRLRNLLLVSLAVVVVAVVVWGVQEHQRRTVDRSFTQSESVQGMLAGMLDQETALRGYAQFRDPVFLEPYAVGQRLFSAQVRTLRETAGSARAIALVDASEAIARTWSGRADQAIVRIRLRGSRSIGLRGGLERKAIMDRFRKVNGELRDEIDDERQADLRHSQRLSVLLVFALAAGFGGAGWLVFGRPAERERRRRIADLRRRDLQTEFARTMQVMDGERDAHELVKRHLERTLAGTTVTVLQRNNSADRLLAATPLADGDPLAAALVDAEPRSCLAVRLGSPHGEEHGNELLQCELCGKTGSERALCTPLVVSGEVIGAVLVGHDAGLGDSCRQVIDDTVTQAAPVLANMRNLAMAEEQAATDALTGLANRRSVQDTVRRMVAQAQRAEAPLALLAIDVDHFKRVNDRFGHDRGDDVLAAVGQSLSGTLRASDFVGRQGGEEFIALLPDTDLSGALTAAENLRAAIEGLDVLGADEVVTASFGIAVMPEDGQDGPTLMRQADRALYAAKANGRNRVETAASGAVRAPLEPLKPLEPVDPQTAA